jgi:hypothetical protein
MRSSNTSDTLGACPELSQAQMIAQVERMLRRERAMRRRLEAQLRANHTRRAVDWEMVLWRTPPTA